MPYNPAIHGAYVDAYDHHRQQNPQQANDWIDKLKREFYDRGNSVGTSALYAAIQKRHPAANAYPTWKSGHASAGLAALHAPSPRLRARGPVLPLLPRLAAVAPPPAVSRSQRCAS